MCVRTTWQLFPYKSSKTPSRPWFMGGHSTPDVTKILVYDNYIFVGVRTTENRQVGRVSAYLLWTPIPVAEPSKPQFCVRPLAGIVGSVSAGGTDVSVCECCVLSRSLCDRLITRAEESYWVWCVVVCGLETEDWHDKLWPQRRREGEFILLPLEKKKWWFNCSRDKSQF